MYPNDAGRKRGRSDAANGNGSVTSTKRSKETESNQSGLGGKSKPCTKFFSTSGCPFGEGCHFLHYVPGGYGAVTHITNRGITALAPASRNPIGPNPIADGPPVAKTRLCNKYNTAEGCKFGDKCHFAHGERELGRPLHSGHEHLMAGRLVGRLEPPPPPGLGPAASFGASATAKISVDASLAGAIIGKGGVNTKQICRLTGAKLFIREHETDSNLRNIELEGTFDQIKQATGMVRELIVNISSAGVVPVPVKPAGGFGAGGGGGPGSNFKTKICDNFTKGSCTFGERCHFAHGAADLRKAAA
uniref:Zinc finger CCCH domain-containing protein 14-like isoform X1 n=1 Tax=Cymbidium ensifolium TaxID=78740 RepID=A0A5J6NA26_CYMEN|nr:zinc finger CCCH domain-containing protein 14-like isoform X1 [Cymbidium ensifolium]